MRGGGQGCKNSTLLGIVFETNMKLNVKYRAPGNSPTPAKSHLPLSLNKNDVIKTIPEFMKKVNNEVPCFSR